MMDLIVKNGRVVDPARNLDKIADVFIRDGKIRDIGNANGADVAVLDAKGLIVAPGFFDIHVHLREPGRLDREVVVDVVVPLRPHYFGLRRRALARPYDCA